MDEVRGNERAFYAPERIEKAAGVAKCSAVWGVCALLSDDIREGRM